MGSAAELISEVEEDVNWHIAGQTFGLIFHQACMLVAEKPELGIPPSPPPDPSKTPSPNLLQAKECVKRVLDCVDDLDSEDLRSTVGRTSSLADDSRSICDVDLADSECDAETLRALTRDLLGKGAESGSLAEMLQTAIISESDKSQPGCQTTEKQNQALPLRESSQAEVVEEVCALAKEVMVKGLHDGSLKEALEKSFEQEKLVPRPPEGAPLVKSYQRPIPCPRTGDGRVDEVLQKISFADRKVGHLHVQICQKQSEIREKDARCKMITDNIQQVQDDLGHLGVDLQWHQDQILAAEDRWNRLNEDRKAVAFKLDEMRMIKNTTPGTKAPNTAQSWGSTKAPNTAQSWTSTASGGAFAETSNSIATPGWATDRSAILDKQIMA